MFLFIDFREKGFIQKLQDAVETPLHFEIEKTEEVTIKSTGLKLKVKISNLPVGDFILRDDDSTILMIVERKSIKDLSASITDGRFREQKERLLDAVGDENRITYVIEGNKKNVTGISHTIIDGSILNLVFRHRYKVLHTDNENDTFSTLLLLCKKYCNSEMDGIVAKVAPFKPQFKGDKIKQNMLATQLSVIPGVSYNVGLAISQVYSSMKQMMDAYSNQDTDDTKKYMLSHILVGDKRKVGNAVSSKIFTALHDSYQEDTVE
jgi:ERCC4-type nuclease